MLARELRDWQVMASPLNSLGFAVLDGGEHERASQLFAEALVLQQKLGRAESIAWNLEGLAEVAATRKQMARAATLCAAAQALREEIGVPRMLAMQERYERTIAAVRALLGETAFAAAWREGRMMPQDDAIVYALAR